MSRHHKNLFDEWNELLDVISPVRMAIRALFQKIFFAFPRRV
jgi:hypothetical protein